jgi:hypothetical protein
MQKQLGASLLGLGLALATWAPPAHAAEACSDAARPPVTLPAEPTFGDFWRVLGQELDGLDQSALRPTFEAFAARHGADAQSPQLWHEFARLWLAFEATRDGGFWRLRWRVTDQEPSSNEIWKAWLRATPTASFTSMSTVAECDEITSLFALTARHLGVRGVGLFYPTWNHVIAGWAPAAGLLPHSTVVLVPTTQIFQECSATFDETSFKTPRHVYEYPRTDVRDERPMPAALATFLLEQVRAYGEATPTLQALIRTKRAELFRSSLGNCGAFRQQLARQLAGALSCADQRSLRHMARVELGRAELSARETLAFLETP